MHGCLLSPARFAELEQYTELDFKPTSKKHCDITVKKPTIFMKLDAGTYVHHVTWEQVEMPLHFCMRSFSTFAGLLYVSEGVTVG